jgi:hypothetical protein
MKILRNSRKIRLAALPLPLALAAFALSGCDQRTPEAPMTPPATTPTPAPTPTPTTPPMSPASAASR